MYHGREKGNCLVVPPDKKLIDCFCISYFKIIWFFLNAIYKFLIPVFGNLTFGLMIVICMQIYGLLDEEYI